MSIKEIAERALDGEWEEGDIAELARGVLALAKERDEAIHLLADWCYMVDRKGSGWDDWDEGYKNAMYRDTPLRALIDAEVARISYEEAHRYDC